RRVYCLPSQDPSPSERYTLSLHDALPILLRRREFRHAPQFLRLVDDGTEAGRAEIAVGEGEDRLLEIRQIARADLAAARAIKILDRKSTRLNSSHLGISYAVFCLKKKKIR